MTSFDASITETNSTLGSIASELRIGCGMHTESGVSIAINSSYFTNNHANGGGIVHTRDSSIAVDNGSFDHNHVGRDGGTVMS